MFSLRKSALIGLSITTIALTGCLGGGGGSSSGAAPTEPQEELTAQQQRIADGFFVVDESVTEEFDAPVSGIPTERYSGTLEGAGYRVEVPPNWNGTLVMWAHGFRGEGAELTVDNHPLREYLIANGYAWAASSYSANFYDVRAGVIDTNRLALAFSDITGAATPTRYLITGASMGGHVTGAAIEVENIQALAQVDLDVNYAGAMPICGVMGDSALFDYFGGYGVSLLELSGQGTGSYPISAEEAPGKLAAAREALWVNYDEDPAITGLTQEGLALAGVLQNLSGGARPIYPVAFGFYQDLLQGFVGSDGTVEGILNNNIVDTSYLRYRFESQQPGPNMPGNPDESGLTPLEQGFNASVPQSTPDNNVNPLRDDGPRLIPQINGEFDVPVVSLHNLGDLFVPFSMQQIYRNRVISAGNEDLLVQRAIRAVEHCDFTPQELVSAFDGLVDWLDNGNKPAGDEILDPNVVADPDYGCQFSTERFAGTPFACSTPEA